MSVRELAYWRAFDSLEPVGFRGFNYLFAKLQQAQYIASPKFKSDKAIPIHDLLLDFDPEPEQFMDEEERKQFEAEKMKAFFQSLTR